MRVPSIPLGIGGREDGVDKNEGAHDLSTQAITLGVASGHHVCSTAVALVEPLPKPLHHTSTADGTQALHHHVEESSVQGELPRQEQPEGHGRVDVAT